jgi:hypothetical protein
MRVTREYFLLALHDTQSAFGIEGKMIETLSPCGLCKFSGDFSVKRRKVQRYIVALQHSERMVLTTFLIYGLPGTGLTTFSVQMANEGFGYMKVLTAKQFIGRSEDIVCHEIIEYFENAYKSVESAIVIDDLESMIEFSLHGSRFAHKILQGIQCCSNVFHIKNIGWQYSSQRQTGIQ